MTHSFTDNGYLGTGLTKEQILLEMSINTIERRIKEYKIELKAAKKTYKKMTGKAWKSQ